MALEVARELLNCNYLQIFEDIRILNSDIQYKNPSFESSISIIFIEILVQTSTIMSKKLVEVLTVKL